MNQITFLVTLCVAVIIAMVVELDARQIMLKLPLSNQFMSLIRIRPLLPKEVNEMNQMCTAVIPNEPQIILDDDRAFTFDYVFDTTSQQPDVYDKTVSHLVDESLKGYNTTVLAYGQTGTGKTHTMGTFTETNNFENEGIIPRAVKHIFAAIKETQGESIQSSKCQYAVSAQFIEIHNNDVIDLLDSHNKSKAYEIRENMSGDIYVDGATIRPLNCADDAMSCLQQGLLARTTAWTQINEHSSRSHALFTLLICRQRIVSSPESATDVSEIVKSKFHLVDLAGSERLQRSGATGERAREGISINCGLFALGNVISALGDKSLNATHIPYRNSKLTRLLQDSLGGNSQTLMIACISPSYRDIMETLNTLKYANRARNIKNHAEINQDENSRMILMLRKQIAELQLELSEYKEGKRCSDVEETIGYLSTVLEETDNNLNDRKGALRTTEADPCEVSTDKSATHLINEIFQVIQNLQECIAETNQKIKVGLNSLRNITDLKVAESDDSTGSESSESNSSSKSRCFHCSFNNR